MRHLLVRSVCASIGCLLATFVLCSASSPQPTRAVLISVDRFDDGSVPRLEAPERDMRLMAAWLQSRGGGLVPPEHIRLLADSAATVSGMTTALDWLFETARTGERLILMFSGYVMVPEGNDCRQAHLLGYDTPGNSPLAAALPYDNIRDKLEYLFKNLGNDYTILIMGYGTEALNLKERMPSGYTAANQKYHCYTSNATIQRSVTPGKTLVDALMGAADFDDDQRIMARELDRKLRELEEDINWSGAVVQFTFARPDQILARYDPEQNLDLSLAEPPAMPVFFRQETTRSEDSLIRSAGAQLLFQDFILAIKLGNLLEPEAHSARALYDSLIGIPALKPMQGRLRRQLAAALLDATQQALNAYLSTDSRELLLRWEGSAQCQRWPIYMETAIELLGKNHYMHRMFETKRLYFAGLVLRLEGQKASDSILSRDFYVRALDLQKKAIQLEPAASFVWNEMGLLHALLRTGDAIYYYRQATLYSPRWAAPYNNISYEMMEAGHFREAIWFARIAVVMSPYNAFAANTLGEIYLNTGQYQQAEWAFRRAAGIEPKYTDNYIYLARVQALQGQYDDAMLTLGLALKNGYTNAAAIQNQKDFAPLHQRPDFDELLQMMAKGRE